jgi:hypothetical protein
MADAVSAAGWLVLIYQLRAKHSPARVKAWRRLQRIGAVTLKNSAYVIPNSAEAREDFEWIKTEIVAIGGQAMVLAADALDAATNREILDQFRAARGRDFDAIRVQARSMLARVRSIRPAGAARRRLVQSIRRLRERFREIEVIDFFDAPHRSEAARLLIELDRLAKRGTTVTKPPAPSETRLDANDYAGRVWVTRSRPGVDRMSSAWLIRRFIDPNAKFAFGEVTDRTAMVPFDVFGAPLGHQGAFCTFETIAARFGIRDPAVAWLGRIVHDLDLKEDTYGVPEKAAVGRLVEGLRRMYHDDHMLISEGVTMFEALYQSYRAHEPESSASPSAANRLKPRPKKRRGRK